MKNIELYKKLLLAVHNEESNEVLNCLACLCSQVAIMNDIDKEKFVKKFANHIDENWEMVEKLIKESYERHTN